MSDKVDVEEGKTAKLKKNGYVGWSKLYVQDEPY